MGFWDKYDEQENKYTITITGDELMLLDGKGSETTQKWVDHWKLRTQRIQNMDNVPENLRSLFASLAETADKTGEIKYHHHTSRSFDKCLCCGKQGAYAVYKRTSRNKHGMITKEKGKTDYDNYIGIYGVMLGHQFVCNKCYNDNKDTITQFVNTLPAEYGYPPLKVKVHWHTCTNCKWSGYGDELKITRHTYMMDPRTDLKYKECPGCGGKDEFFIDNFTKDYTKWRVAPSALEVIKERYKDTPREQIPECYLNFVPKKALAGAENVSTTLESHP